MASITKLNAILIVLVLVLAAATVYSYSSKSVGTNTVTTTLSVGGSSSQPQLDLLNAAKAEGGNLVIYTAWLPATCTYIMNVFQKTYPFAHVSCDSLQGSDINTKVLAELQAGKVQSDVFYLNTVDIPSLSPAMANYTSYEYPISNNGSSNPCVTFHVSCVDFETSSTGLVYNTNIVKPNQVPTTISDLGNPIWKNQIVTDHVTHFSGSGIWFADYYLYENQTNANNATWTNMMKAIAANNISPGPAGQCMTLVASGQDAICFGGHHDDYEASLATGAPVGWVWLNPYAPYFADIYALSKGAPDPAMGILFLEWIVSEQGQLAVASEGSASASNPYILANTGGVPSNLTVLSAQTAELAFNVTLQNQFIAAYQKIFGNVSGL